MSQTAPIEYMELWNTLQQISLNDQPDKLIWQQTPNGLYTAKSAYSMLHSEAITFVGAQTNLEDLGSSSSKNLFVVSNEAKTLDS
jgi:hypothetical protein